MLVSSTSPVNNNENINLNEENKKISKTELVASEVLNNSQSQNETNSDLDNDFVLISNEENASSTNESDNLEDGFVVVDGKDAQEVTYTENRMSAVSTKVVRLMETADKYGMVITYVAPQAKPFLIALKTLVSAKQIIKAVSLRKADPTLSAKVERTSENVNKVLRCAEGVMESVALISPETASKFSTAKGWISSTLHYTRKAQMALNLYHRCVQPNKSTQLG